eukprot:SAG31_NODE_1253_length_9089_cov_17.716765_11_plen_252_part_01
MGHAPFSRQTALGLCAGVRTGANRAPPTFRRLRPRHTALLHRFFRNLGSRRLVGAGDGVLMADPMRGARSDQPFSRQTALGLCGGVRTGANRAPPTFRRLRPRQPPLLHRFFRNLGPRRLVGAGDGVLMADPMRGARSDQPFSRQTALGLCGGVRTGANRAPPTLRRLRPRHTALLHRFFRNLGSRRLVGAGDGVLMADPMRGARSDQPFSRQTALGLCGGVRTGANRAPPTLRRLRPRHTALLHRFFRNLG